MENRGKYCDHLYFFLVLVKLRRRGYGCNELSNSTTALFNFQNNTNQELKKCNSQYKTLVYFELYTFIGSSLASQNSALH